MLDTKLYVFGGQAEGSFMNDLWSYDIRQRTSSVPLDLHDLG
jgi:hypothetical protein